MRFGPGLLVTAAFIGPGTITSASIAGANFGFTLAWTLLFSVIVTISLQSMAARLGVATGQDLAQALRAHIHTPIFKVIAAILVISAIGVGSAAYEAGNLSGASLGLIGIFPEVNSHVWTPLIAIFSALLLYSGKHKMVESALIILVLLMSLVFISTLIIAAPPIEHLLKGFIPSIPEGSMTTVLALIGTTIVPYNLFLHSGILAAKHDKNSNTDKVIKQTNLDTGISITLGGVITLAILSTASVAFYGTDAGKISAANMASQLEPLLGNAAQYFFAVGLFAAGLTSAITAPLAGAYAVCGMLGWSNDMKSRQFKWVALVILVFGATVASLRLDPIAVIIFAQAANGLLLPIVTFYLVWLVNQKAVMGKYTNSLLVNLLTLPMLLLILGLSSYKLINMIV
ncbi:MULTISPECIES: Nramp family divalent metal transporter [unclassified Pseudoalteromonas]|uniref:Nramp family divalent metal transporter n=1 Tax=unclassified Pseudoalteromonas TaxID=194690 RepID=UPI000C06CFC4|nr:MULTISPECIES: Nramp family divalent metal transporter [unclassified Pseudoalteromonas]MDP2633638.1 Nramp family divalent metal transporter [Pseudoalteromonas sp. 1_MG-2023]PHN89623.1 manganese transporter [Pseudoalteromonas sp. 3D05]